MKIFTLILLLFSNQLFAQTNEVTDIDFMVNKIKHSYAGYRDKVNSKEFEQLIESVKKTKTKDTFQNLSRLTLYFNDHHLRIFEKFTVEDIDKKLCLRNLDKISKARRSKNKYEGYWINDLNSMIVYLSISRSKMYNGYLVETKNKIEKGFCIFKIFENEKKELVTDYYNIIRGKRMFLKSNFKNDSILSCNSFSVWRKINNYSNGYLDVKTEILKMPSLDLSDENNVILKMPSFNREMKKTYDSLISNNINKIRNSKNLIIDIRNNGGGVVNCFDSILPYICTDTIKNFGGYRLVNDDLIEGIQKNAIPLLKSNDSLRIQRYYKYLAEMNSLRDSFLYSKGGVFFICNSKSNKIENVAIVTNDRCLSAAELMIIYLRQSKKVKTFGEKTGGAVDYINASEFNLPKSNYIFWVASIKREISIVFPQYDNIGIQPDIEISNNNTDWIKFIKGYYDKN